MTYIIFNNIVKILTNILLPVCPGCYVQPLSPWQSLRWSAVVLGGYISACTYHVPGQSQCMFLPPLCQRICDVAGISFSFLETRGVCAPHFTPGSISLVCQNLIGVAGFLLESWVLFPLLPLRKMLFLDPRLLITSADGRWVAYSHRVSTVILYPIPVVQCSCSFALHPICPLQRLLLPHHALYLFPNANDIIVTGS